MSRSLVIGVLALSAPLILACGKEDATYSPPDTASSDIARLRDEYRREKQRDLTKLDKRIAELETREKSAAATVKADLGAQLATIKAGREAFLRDLNATESSGASSWDATKARLEQEWSDLTTSTDKAAGVAVSGIASTKASELTCEQFLALGDVEKPKAAYWLEGFNRNGKLVDSFVDLQETDRMVPILTAECSTKPAEALSKVVQRHTSSPAKPAAAAPRPETLTCQEFLALDDVVKPRLVYWARGFNPAGGASDSALDIEATDKLVPVLVRECAESPKLTFWQKVRGYL
jgi:hypothetical protein